MTAASPSSLESNLRLFFGFLLWAVSATLTFVLLLSLGDGSVSKILLGVVAVALEGAKILAWRKGGIYRIYAACLIILSGIASLGASLQVVEKSKGSFLSITRDDVRSSPAYLAEEVELSSIDTEISALVSRLKFLPPDYTTATAQTESSLAALRDRKQGILDSLTANECFLSSGIPGIRHMSFPENATGNSRLSPSRIFPRNVTMTASASIQAPPSCHLQAGNLPAMADGWIVQKSIGTVSFSLV
jgi:hypothetical protein